MQCGCRQLPCQNSSTLVKGGDRAQDCGYSHSARCSEKHAWFLIRRKHLGSAVDSANKVTLPDGDPITAPFRGVACTHTTSDQQVIWTTRRGLCRIRNKALSSPPKVGAGSWRGCFKTLLCLGFSASIPPQGVSVEPRHMAIRFPSVMRIH